MVTRQAVNRHLKFLDQHEIVLRAPRSNATLRYIINTDGLEDGRMIEEFAADRAGGKRRAREKTKAAPSPAPPRAPPSPDATPECCIDETSECCIDEASKVASMQPLELARRNLLLKSPQEIFRERRGRAALSCLAGVAADEPMRPELPEIAGAGHGSGRGLRRHLVDGIGRIVVVREEQVDLPVSTP
jgi:hypothetical protein